MKNWEKLENDATIHLQTKYKGFIKTTPVVLDDGTIEQGGQGGQDSTVSDIYITANNNNEFYVEVKQKTARCIHFSLIPNETEEIFEYSDNNVTIPKYDIVNGLIPEIQKIIDYMNENYEVYFNTKDTKGAKYLPLDIFTQDVLYNIIKYFYTKKKSKYFITQNKSKDFILFSIDNFLNYFYVNKAVYRIHKSGTKKLSNNKYKDFIKTFEKYFNISSENYVIFKINVDEKTRYYLGTNIPIETVKQFNTQEIFYFLSENNNPTGTQVQKYKNWFEIRQKGTTSNPAIMFSIQLKNDAVQNQEDLKLFENEIGYTQENNIITPI